VPVLAWSVIRQLRDDTVLNEVVIGMDPHKRSHTLVAVDGVGRKLAEQRVGTTSEDH